MNTIPCFLCGERLEIRITKKKKPYLVCEDCGYQFFARERNAIRRLRELSEKGISLLDPYVVCRKCRVAVEKCPENVTSYLFGGSGIHCPKCEQLLVKMERT